MLLRRERGRQPRSAVPLALVAVLLVVPGCERSPVVEPTPATEAPVAAPLLPPAGFPAEFPEPPDGVPLHRTRLVENSIEDMDGTQHGTVVHRAISYEFGEGREEDVDAVLGHYRAALPAGGWTINSEEELVVDPDRGREHPGTRLRTSGHGYAEVVVTVERRDRVVSVTVGMLESLEDRAPYWRHPPLIELPDWFVGLADLPGGAVREKIEVTEVFGGPATVRIHFHADDLIDAVTDHYRAALPAAGWTIVDETTERDSHDYPSGPVETEHQALQFEGHGVTGTVNASQALSSSEAEPNPVSASVTVSADPVTPDVE